MIKNICVCDICGKQIEDKINKVFIKRGVNKNIQTLFDYFKEFDTCNGCTVKIENFIKGITKESK